MNRNLITIAVLSLGLIFAIVAGTNIGTSDYESLGIYAATAVVIYFFAHGWRNVWWFAALLIFSGVLFLHSFEFNVEHLFFLMICLASLMLIVSRGSVQMPREIRDAGSRGTAAVIGLLLLYGCVHFIVNFAMPYSQNDYSLKSSSKAYFDCFATMTCFFWLLIGPYGFYLKRNWPRTLILIIFAALAGNVLLRGAMFMRGFQAVDGVGESSVDYFSWHIPVINMYAGVYTLRHLSPIATVVLLMMATSPGAWRNSPQWLRGIVVVSVALCFVGALLSGGRATLLLCLLMVGLVAIVRRRTTLIVFGGVSGVLAVALINIFSHQINNEAPSYIARSVQFVMIEKGNAYRSIEGSQETRDAARKAALVEWRKDTRVFLFGRSVYRISWEDAYYVGQKYGLDGFVMNAMRSGRTHNLVTDLLLQYGIVGCVLYLTAFLWVAVFFRRLWRVTRECDPMARSLVGAMMIYLPPIFVYQVVGGTFMPSIAVLVLGITRSHLVMFRRPVAELEQAAPQHARGRIGGAVLAHRS